MAATSVGTVFFVNAATFLAVMAVIAAWRGTRPAAMLPREHLGDAIRAGGRYVSASPALRVILLRALLFIFFASSVWALLPLTARSELHLGSGGYGLLLGCVGVGAVAGALLLPKLRVLLPAGGQLTVGSLGLGAVALVLALVHVTVVVAVMLVVGGLVWVLSLSTLNSLYQLTLPGWVKARGMSFYLIVFQGGNAIGSALLGLMAELAGLTATLVTAAVALGVGPLIGMRFPFQQIAPESLLPAGDWPAPVAVADGDPGGPAAPAAPAGRAGRAGRAGHGVRAVPAAARSARSADRGAQGRQVQPPPYRGVRLAGLARCRRSGPRGRAVHRRLGGRSTCASTSGPPAAMPIASPGSVP